MDLEIQSRSVGGRFTTIEGLVVEIRDEASLVAEIGKRGNGISVLLVEEFASVWVRGQRCRLHSRKTAKRC